MKLEYLQKLVQDCAKIGKPKTIILTVDDAKSLGIPLWTKQLWGLKVVIASNIEKSKVVQHVYETVTLKKESENEHNYRQRHNWGIEPDSNTGADTSPSNTANAGTILH